MKILHSLRGQLSAAFIIVLAMGLGLLLLMAGSQMQRMTFEAYEHEQQVFALLTASTLIEPLQHNQLDAIQSSFAMLPRLGPDSKDEDINLSIFGMQGDLVLTSLTSNVDSIPSPEFKHALSDGMSTTIAPGVLRIAVPIMLNEHQAIGVLYMKASLAVVNSRMLSRWLVLIAAAIGALFIAYLVAFWLSARLIKPLSEIRSVAQKMADGQLDVRVNSQTSIIELQSLSSMFDHMAERIEQMMAKQREFVANASHELRSPLSTIKLRAEALADHSVTEDRARQYAGEINDEIGNMSQLVNSLLQLSKAESGTFIAPNEPINAVDDLKTCIRSVQPKLHQKHQTLTTEIPDDLPDFFIYPNELRIMVGNLLDNAIKYTPENGEITLKTSWADQQLKILVSDNGVGIPPEDLPRISERFFRVDRAHTRNVPGAGLGLALVVALAHQYNGDLKVTSTGLAGQGTQATLILKPLSRAAEG